MTDTETLQENASPALWNPNAAASWCLLLSPAFGAYLHAENWKALGEPEKAAKSRLWFNASIAMLTFMIMLSIFMPQARAADVFSRVFAFAFLLTWYFSSAKEQVAYIKAKYGDSYLRRPWGRPLLATLGIFVGCFIAVFVIAFIAALFGGSPASSSGGM